MCLLEYSSVFKGQWKGGEEKEEFACTMCNVLSTHVTSERKFAAGVLTVNSDYFL
jgi:hypothetical protein